MADEKKFENFSSGVLNLKKIGTLDRLTKYERARILGTRAAQIQNGMPPVFIKDGVVTGIPDEYKNSVNNSYDIAKLELQHNSTPLVVKRQLPSGTVDEKTVQELL